MGEIRMEIIDLLSSYEFDNYFDKLRKCDWKPVPFLCDLIINNRLEELFGKNPKAFLLTNNKEIVSFCTYVYQDEIRDETMFPWIGFVYTYPKYRGNRYFGKLLDYIVNLARKENYQKIYVSTNEIGLYEKYGFIYYKNMLDFTGNDSRIYYLNI